MTKTVMNEAIRMNRRLFVAGAAGLFMPTLLSPAAAAAGNEAAQRIADHFSAVKTLTGEFVQFGPKGEQTGGVFFIERPGKIRFNYEKPSPIRVIADGKNVVVNNKKLDTWDLYPLGKTPLKLLLSDKIELTGERVKSVKEEADLTTIVMGDKSVFGNSKITLMFDPGTFDLKQWTITDAQGLDTTVMIFNTKSGVAIKSDTFKIDYDHVHATKAKKEQ